MAQTFWYMLKANIKFVVIFLWFSPWCGGKIKSQIQNDNLLLFYFNTNEYREFFNFSKI